MCYIFQICLLFTPRLPKTNIHTPSYKLACSSETVRKLKKILFVLDNEGSSSGSPCRVRGWPWELRGQICPRKSPSSQNASFVPPDWNKELKQIDRYFTAQHNRY
jgi:hypothetical protein